MSPSLPPHHTLGMAASHRMSFVPSGHEPCHAEKATLRSIAFEASG